MDLNDDCLMLIFSLLDLNDQVSAARACRRFHDVLSSLWQRTYRIYEDISPDTLDELAVLMESICGTVQAMDLGSLTYEEWDVIKLHTYPRVESLDFCQPETCSDECILEMTEVFPNLRSFCPNSPDISGKYIENWRLLEYINFYDCEKVMFSQFEKIMMELQLKSISLYGLFAKKWTSELAFKKFCNLERIHLSSRELVLVQDLLLFSNLKEIGLFDLNSNLILQLLKDVTDHKHNNLIELYVTRDFLLDSLLIRTFVNLKKISLLSRDTSDWIKISKCAPHLREIVLKKCDGLQTDQILIWLNSTQLELINVENCKCEFSDIRLNVKDIVKQRNVLLHFNFYENTFRNEKVSLNIKGDSGLLKITSKNLEPDWVCPDRLIFS